LLTSSKKLKQTQWGEQGNGLMFQKLSKPIKEYQCLMNFVKILKKLLNSNNLNQQL